MPITARTIAALPPQWLQFIPASSLCRRLSIPPGPRTLKGSLAAAPKILTDSDEKVTDIARSIAHELKGERLGEKDSARSLGDWQIARHRRPCDARRRFD